MSFDGNLPNNSMLDNNTVKGENELDKKASSGHGGSNEGEAEADTSKPPSSVYDEEYHAEA